MDPDTETTTAAASPDAIDTAIDAMFGDGDAAPPPQKPVAPPASAPEPSAPPSAAKVTPPASPKPEPPKPSSEDPFNGDVPSRTQKKTETITEPKTEKPGSLKEFRSQYESAVKERDTLKAEIEAAKTKIEQARREGETAAEARYKAELEALKKDREELDTRVRLTDYTKSQEYREKYVTPLEKAWKTVLTEFDGVTITGEDGTETKADESHMMTLLRLPTVQAARQATAWFGPAASEIMQYRRTILDLNQRRTEAVEEWKQKGSALAERQRLESEQRQSGKVAKFDEHVTSLRTTAPDLFTPSDDPEAKAFFDKGQQIVDLAFRGVGLKEGMSQEERESNVVRAQANVAAKAAAFGVVVHRLNKAMEEIEALQSKLKSFETTEPGTGKLASTDPSSKAYAKPEDAIDDM